MMHVNRWSPDTCDCVFDYQWDDSVPAEQRVHTIKDVVHACPDHLITSTNKANHYDVVIGENVRKNKVHGQLLELPDMAGEVLQDDGTMIRNFKKGIGFNFHFTGKEADRVLSISTNGYKLNQGQKNALQDWCHQNLGNGKVVIQ
jgi:hypothetical protein